MEEHGYVLVGWSVLMVFSLMYTLVSKKVICSGENSKVNLIVWW